MSNLDFQNGFIAGAVSGGVVEVEDTTKIDALEDLIDNSGVLEDTEGSVTEKVEELIEIAQSGGSVNVSSLEVDYIESKGTEYIDTGYKPKPNSWYKTMVLVETNEIGETGFVFGGRINATNENVSINLGINGGAACGRGSYYANLKNTGWETNKFHEYTVKPDIITIDGRTVSTDVSDLSQEATYSIYLFGCNQMGSLATLTNGSLRNIKGKMRYFQIYEDETLVRDFIPFISREKNHLNEICLYDKVTQKYFYNQGAGSFSGGYVITEITRIKPLMEEITLKDTSGIIDFGYTFKHCSSLKTISTLDFTNTDNANQCFQFCSALENISFVAESMKVSISFAWSPLLSAESIQSIIDGLATVETAQTLALQQNIALTDEQKATINEKGWTLAQ